MNRALSGATIRRSGPGTNGNEEALHISQSSRITGTSSSDCLVSYPGHLLLRRGAEVYSTAPTDRESLFPT